jgi:Flp pilus assembly protein TadD
MAVGFILALIPTALVLTGLACVCARCYRAVSLSWLLLLGLGWLFAFAIVDMSLKVPSYEQTKAFFGLPALLPFCALGGLGYEFWSGRGKNVQSVLRVALGIWLFTVYASFWIKPNSAQTGLSSAIAASVYVKGDSSKAFVKLLERYPGNSEAIIWLASLEAREHPEQGVKRLEQALKDDPANASIEASLAWDMARCGRLDEAIVHAKLAVELAPEDEIVARGRCTLELRHKNFEESIAAGRHALSLNPTDLETHFNLGVALMNLRQIPEAISHLSSVVRASPAWAEANFDLGLCLLDQTGKRDEALDHLHEAVRLNPTNTAWRAALQKALR